MSFRAGIVLCIVVSLLLTATGCGGARQGNTAGTEVVTAPPAVPAEEKSEPPIAPQLGGTNQVKEGPYYSLLTMEAGQVEERLGKPTQAAPYGNLAGAFLWTYEDLGLKVILSTHTATGKVIAVTLTQTQGRIIGDLKAGDTEEQVARVMGPSRKTPQGEQISQVEAEGCVFTVTLKNGVVTKARIEPAATR